MRKFRSNRKQQFLTQKQSMISNLPSNLITRLFSIPEIEIGKIERRKFSTTLPKLRFSRSQLKTITKEEFPTATRKIEIENSTMHQL